MTAPTGAGQRKRDPGSRMTRAGDLASRVGSLDPGNPLMRRGLHVGIGLIVVLGLGLAITATLDRLPDVEWRWQPLSLALGLLAVALFLIANGELWRRVLRALGAELPPVPAGAIWFVSGLGRFVPTSLLTPMIRMAMAEREGVAKRITLVSVVYEIALALSGGLVVGAYFIIDLPELSGYWQRYLAAGLPICALVVLQPAIFQRVTAYALRRLGREPLALVLPLGRVLEFMGLYALVYVLAGLSTYALGQSVYPIDAGDAITVLGAYAVGTTLGIVAFFLPGGLVAREAGLAVALSPIMPTAPAVAIAVLARVAQIGMEVVLATLAQLLARRGGYPELDTSAAGSRSGSEAGVGPRAPT